MTQISPIFEHNTRGLAIREIAMCRGENDEPPPPPPLVASSPDIP